MKDIYEELILGLSALAIFYLIFTTAFYLPYYDQSFYEDNFRENGAYAELGKEETDQIHSALKQYLDEDYFGYDRTHLLSEFNAREQAHMKDVKKIIDWVCILFYLALTTLAITLFFKRNKEFWTHSLMLGGGASLAFITLLAVTYFINFDALFNAMHGLLFPAGSWTFPTDSLLITLYPSGFFQEFTLRFLTLALVLSGACLGAGWHFKSTS